MKKLVSLLLLTVLAAAPAAVFAQAQKDNAPKKAAAPAKPATTDYSFLNGKTGAVPLTRWNEANFRDIINNRFGARIEKFIYNDSMTGSLFMLKSGRADFVLVSDISANYVAQRNPDIKPVIFPFENNLVMVFRNSDVKLRDQFNSAIDKLKTSGKLASIYKKWITELPAGQDPNLQTVEKTSYIETIYVGVSGDLPPLDFVSAGGRPAGYNLALSAEISRLIQKNIVVTSLDSSARFAALESKKIDVFFWQLIPNSKFQEDFTKKLAGSEQFTKKFIVTKPYCAIKAAVLLKK